MKNIMSFDDDIAETIRQEKEFEKRSDPFELAKQKLRERQETIHEDPKKPYVTIEIPETGKIGGECLVKFSKTVPKAQLAISQDIQWKRRDKYDLKAKPEIVCRAFIIEEKKNTDHISSKWEDVGIVAQVPTNLLLEGEYMVEARAYSTEAGEETTARRIVRVTK